MSPELLIAVIAGLGGMLGWGLADFFAKKTIDEVGDIVSLVWAHIFGTLFLLLIVAYGFISGSYSTALPSDMATWGLLAFFGALQALVYIFVYRGFGRGKVSILNPIFASFSGLVALFSILFLKENVDYHSLVILFGIFVGVIFLSFDIEAWKNNKKGIIHTPGAKDILVATLLATLWTITWARFVNKSNWIMYAFLMYGFMTIVLFLYSKIKSVNLKISKAYVWKYLALIGIFEIVAYLAISLGYGATAKTSIVALLSGAFSLPTIILARIFFKEQLTKIHMLGITLIVTGIMLISAF